MAHQITYNERPLLPDESAIGIFNHIPKCGGTNLHQSLIASGISCALLYGYDILDITHEIFPHKQVYSSHDIDGMHYLLNNTDKYFYFTFIRDPYQKALSMYKFINDIYKNNSYTINCDINRFLYEYPHNNLIRFLGGGTNTLPKKTFFQNMYFLVSWRNMLFHYIT